MKQILGTAHEKTSADAGLAKMYEPTFVRGERHQPRTDSYEKQGSPSQPVIVPFVAL